MTDDEPPKGELLVWVKSMLLTSKPATNSLTMPRTWPRNFASMRSPNLLLVVEDLDVGAAVDQAGGGIIGVAFDVLPVPLAVQIIKPCSGS